MKKSILLSTFVLLLAALGANAQTATPQPLSPPSLDTVLSEAQKQTANYRQTFRDLLADEMKTVEEFDSDGDSGKRAAVKSNFLVYGSDAGRSTELRNVIEVNGKIVPDGQRRADEFVAELEKEKTTESRLKKIQKESTKYDKTWEVYGLTLNQGVTLKANLRPFFEFQMIGTENYNGSEVYVIGYRQTKATPLVSVNDKNADTAGNNFGLEVPGALKNTDKFLRGKLWIDAKTFQLWREERELFAQTTTPLPLLKTDFEYQTSDYGILVPKKITLTGYEAKKQKGGKDFTAVKESTVVLDYSRFRQANVEIKILDEEN